jgi:hypothetical protein
MECHHIIPEAQNGDRSFENCIPLCFDHHAEVGHYSIEHPKGIKFSPAELRAHRDRWYAQVATGISPSAPSDFAELDKKLYRRTITALCGSGFMTHFRDHNYAYTYSPEVDRRLFNFLCEASLPEFEFFDTQVESVFADFKACAAEYLETAKGRIAHDADNVACILRASWEGSTQPEQMFSQVVTTMDNAAARVWETYAQFVRIARKRLAAEEPSSGEIEMEFQRTSMG